MSSIYKSLLSTKRFKPPDKSRYESDIAAATESDRGRVLYSSPFRRLQQKTQVFPLEDNAAVRSRLTHSLEVAHIGRQIAERAYLDLDSKSRTELGLDDSGMELAFINIVETACLMHDIGNPPFGHFGERAIKNWFCNFGRKTFKKCLANSRPLEEEKEFCFFLEHLVPDFEQFDGNPQGLRIVTRLQWNIDEYGLNLTFSQLAAYLKYLRSPAGPENPERKWLTKKPGYFYSEADLVRDIWSELGLSLDQRFPLAYIMQAADDISYCMSDIEDGLEKRLITQPDMYEKVRKIWEEKSKVVMPADRNFLSNLLDKSLTDSKGIDRPHPFFNFKTDLTSLLLESAAIEFVKLHKQILDGSAADLMDSRSSKEKAALETLKQFARTYLFPLIEVEQIELAGYEIIKGLLNHFRPLLTLSAADFLHVAHDDRETDSGRALDLERRLFHRLPPKYVKTYHRALEQDDGSECRTAKEWFHRAHLIVDYISGMTDRFALETYQMLSGIRVT